MLKRLPTPWLASSLFLAALLVAWPDQAQAQVSDQFSTSGQYDQFAVGGAHRWYDNHSSEAKAKSSHCLSMLDEAKTYQEAAFVLYAQAKQPGLASTQRTALRRQGMEQIKLRENKIRAFIDCFNLANRQKSQRSDQFATGGDSSPLEDGMIPTGETSLPPGTARRDGGKQQVPDRAPKSGNKDQGTTSDVFSTNGDKTPSDEIESQAPSDQPYGSGSDEVRTGQMPREKTPSDIFNTNPERRPRSDDVRTGQDDRHTPVEQKPNRVFVPTEPREKVWNLQQLAAWVFKNYDSKVGPIATVPIKNTAQPTYLLLLSGVDPYKAGRATGTLVDLLIAIRNISPLDAYFAAIMDAVKSLPQKDNLKANLIIVGHSLGGMEAQYVVPRLRELGFHVQHVITYGSPMVTFQDGTTSYHYITAKEDQVSNIYQLQEHNPSIIRIPGGSDPNPFSPHSSHQIYNKSLQLTYRTVPNVPTIHAPCWELDTHNVMEYAAPDLVSRFLRLPSGNYKSALRTCPRNPGFSDPYCGCQRDSKGEHKSSNCFWAALAEDLSWDSHSDSRVEYWAPCEPGGTTVPVIDETLHRFYGKSEKQAVHSLRDVKDALNNPGSRGIVFVTYGTRVRPTEKDARQPGATYRELNGQLYKEEPGNEYRVIGGELVHVHRHVVNARNEDARVLVYDAQSSSPKFLCDASGYFDKHVIEIKLFQTKITAPRGQHHPRSASKSH